jgi:hypothetical protein
MYNGEVRTPRSVSNFSPTAAATSRGVTGPVASPEPIASDEPAVTTAPVASAAPSEPVPSAGTAQ